MLSGAALKGFRHSSRIGVALAAVAPVVDGQCPRTRCLLWGKLKRAHIAESLGHGLKYRATVSLRPNTLILKPKALETPLALTDSQGLGFWVEGFLNPTNT